jgi:hypothetical protein
VSTAESGPDPPRLLDWRDAKHWSWTAKPCRYCDQPTNLRDSKRSPAHKSCAEAALARQEAEAAEAYDAEHHLH